MSQLESLLSIAHMQSEQQLAALQKKKQSIAYLNQQLIELIDYSRSYQQSVVGTDDNLSTLLLHRQRFITQLSKQIDDLTHRISKITDEAAECAQMWHLLEARKKAIDKINERRSAKARYFNAKREQDKSDEFSRFSSTAELNSDHDKWVDYA